MVRLSGRRTADWYVLSGMACLLRGSDSQDIVKPLPAHNAEAAVGAALAGCAATLVFSVAAGKRLGEGRVQYLDVGLYLIQQQHAIIEASPLGRSLYGGETGWSRERLRRAWPVPGMIAFKTTDDQWIQVAIFPLGLGLGERESLG